MDTMKARMVHFLTSFMIFDCYSYQGLLTLGCLSGIPRSRADRSGMPLKLMDAQSGINLKRHVNYNLQRTAENASQPAHRDGSQFTWYVRTLQIYSPEPGCGLSLDTHWHESG